MKKSDTMIRVLKMIRPFGGRVTAALLLAVVSVAATLYAPIVIGEAVDTVVGLGNVDFIQLRNILLRLGVTVAVTVLTQWFMNLVINQISYRVVQDLRREAFNHIEVLPLSYIDGHQPGDIISRIVTDVDQFSDGLLMGFTQFFTGVMTILGTLGFMVSIDFKITIIVVVITPVSFLVASYIARRTFKMFKLQSETRGEMTSLVEEMVGNQRVVQAFSYEERAAGRLDVINRKLQDCGLKAVFYSSITNPSTRFINGLVYTGVGIFGAFSAVGGRISVGQLSSFLNYANQYTRPFNEITGVITELQNALASARRVFALIDEEAERPDAADAAVLKTADGSVAFKDVSFSYRPEVPLIENMNLKVKPGQRIAIVGPTGCGKTTVINLLMRFYEINSGKLIVSGHGIDEITRDSLRTNYGMVLQETWIKSGTILENIAYGKPDASREEVIEAARKTHAHSFIKRMPEGYDTQISDDAGNLSQGQKQLLCIARVMLMEPAMLILDEATSSIDTMTEIRIQKAFEELMEGRTSFIVAHRLSTIKTADIILVMKDGHIIETGSHDKLLEQNGFYANLYQSQFTNS